MKKNILIIAAALFLCLGNQSINAQAKAKKETQSFSIENVEEIAKKKTENLVRPLGLNKEQQEQVYAIFVKNEKKISNSASLDAGEKKEVQSKLDMYTRSAMKEILNEEQFKKYLELSKKL